MPGTVTLWLLMVVPIAVQVPLLWYLWRHIEIDEAPDRSGADIWTDRLHSEDGDADPDGAAHRRRLSAEGSADANADAAADVEGEVVRRCRHCGAANDPEYRFCERCARPV